jgi:lipoprotein Spr
MVLRILSTITFTLILFLSACTHRKKSHLPSKASNSSAAEFALAQKYATKLNVETSAIKNLKLYNFIEDWYAAPYKYGGKSKTGIDCSGFVIRLYNEVYQNEICCSSQTLYNQVNTIDRDQLREGDLVFFKISSDKITHIGLYLMNQKFVHASSSKGVIISDLQEAYYKKYFYKAGRLKQGFKS